MSLHARVLGWVGSLLLVLTATAWSQTIQVTSATPSTAPQGTVSLNVTVAGNGFKKGAKAHWFVTGTTNPGGVTVNSTTVNSSSQLTANITVATDAVLANFDIQVANADGRTGVGSELFAITQSNGPAADMPVTSTVADFDASNLPYSVQSDGSGPYLNGVNNVTSVLMANVLNNLYNGDWQIDAMSSTVRTVAITLTPVPAGSPGYTVPPNPPFLSARVPAKLQTACTVGGKDMLTMTAGSTINCGLLMRWNDPNARGAFYRLNMAGPQAPNFSETSLLLIACNGADLVGCKDWTLGPIPATGIAQLDYITTKGQGSSSNLGDYYVTFSFHLTRP
jgi:hypothetical protein